MTTLYNRPVRTFWVSLVICWMVAVPAVHGQTALHWATAINSSGSDMGHGVTVDAEGNVIAVGYIGDVVDFEPGTGNYMVTSAPASWNAYVVKMNAEGEIQWLLVSGNTEGAQAFGVKTDMVGNVYVTGGFRGTMSLSTATGLQSVVSAGSWDIFVLKLNAFGEVQWIRSMSGTGYDEGFSIDVDSDMNVYTTGRFQGTVDFDPGPVQYNLTSAGGYDIFVSKLDSSGNFVWVRSFGNTTAQDEGRAISVDQAGDIVLTGKFAGTVDFDPGPGTANLSTPNTSPNVFILKLNSNGDHLWAKGIGQVNGEYGEGVALDDIGNVYVVGYFLEYGTQPTDFDPGPGVFNITSAGNYDAFLLKLNAAGDFQWARSISGPAHQIGFDVSLGPDGHVYLTGQFSGVTDFDTQGDGFTMTPLSDEDMFVCSYDADGAFFWAVNAGAGDASGYAIAATEQGVYVSGLYGSMPFTLGIGAGNLLLPSAQNFNAFIAKFVHRGVWGNVYSDLNDNCTKDAIELGLPDRLAIVEPGGFIVKTNRQGFWHLPPVAAGQYMITYDTTGSWASTCSNPVAFTVVHADSLTLLPAQGLRSTAPCPYPNISVHAPFLRRCFSDQRIHVRACNTSLATVEISDASVRLELDSMLTIDSATLPYTVLGENTVSFDLGDMYPGQCADFQLSTTVSCEAVLSQAICMTATLLPVDSCIFEFSPAQQQPDLLPCDLPWDGSHIQVNGWCDGDSIRFTITNLSDLGQGDMICHSPVRMYIDGYYMWLDSVQLSGGMTDTLSFANDGRTWRMEVGQHPLHPGFSQPSVTVELCGTLLNWTPGLVGILPQDDADLMIDTYCGTVTGSYDPNDKTGFPLGVTDMHLIAPDGVLDYVIRFQNTGNDTAFTVVIRDTLDTDLDIFTVQSGVSSHDYSFQMYGPRVLEWTFNNIMLPDSTTDEPGSNGFVCFTVRQVSGLPNGTEINNTADIYFDYNEPIITNTTSHVVMRSPGRTELAEVSITSCDTATYLGISYTQSGVYLQAVSGGADPDTLVTLSVTVHHTADLDLTIVEDADGLLTANASDAAYQWLNCDLGHAFMEGEVGQTFNPLSSGNYAVGITQNGCTDTSACYSVLFTTVSEHLFGDDFYIFPNPTDGTLTISLGAEFPEARITIINAIGQVVGSYRFTDASALPLTMMGNSGVYVVKVVAGTNVASVRVVKR